MKATAVKINGEDEQVLSVPSPTGEIGDMKREQCSSATWGRRGLAGQSVNVVVQYNTAPAATDSSAAKSMGATNSAMTVALGGDK